MRSRNLNTIISAILLIMCGWTLEIYYYYFRYVSDGVPWHVAVVTGGSLTLLLTVLSKYYRIKKVFVLIVLLLAYSIFCTSTGQDVFTATIMSSTESSVNESVSVNNAAFETRQRYLNSIDELTEEYNDLKQLIKDSTGTIEDRAKWRTTIKGAEERQSEITAEKKRYEDLIAALPAAVEKIEKKDISEINTYKRFGKYGTAVQIISQVFLSLFIAIMAPAGVIILTASKSVNEAPADAQKKNENSVEKWKEHVEKWVEVSYTYVEKKRYEFLVERSRFMEYISDKDESFTDYRYEQIRQAAIRAGVMEKRGAQYFPLVEKSEAVGLILNQF